MPATWGIGVKYRRKNSLSFLKEFQGLEAQGRGWKGESSNDWKILSKAWKSALGDGEGDGKERAAGFRRGPGLDGALVSMNNITDNG